MRSNGGGGVDGDVVMRNGERNVVMRNGSVEREVVLRSGGAGRRAVMRESVRLSQCVVWECLPLPLLPGRRRRAQYYKGKAAVGEC